jgi:RNA polymerase sigma-70 factor, ECF subfamily
MIDSGWEPHVELPPRELRKVSRASADPDYFLVIQVQDGNLDAFDALVAKYKKSIVNFAARTLGDPTEAQDIAQNAFVSAFKKSGRFRFACRFSTWLFCIARNLCRNELRRRWRHRAHWLGREGVEGEEDPRWQAEAGKFGSVPEAVYERELREKIEQALASLPAREREAILLLNDEGFSYADVAAVLGISRAAAKTLIHRGRQALKRELRPYLRTGAWRESWIEALARRKPASARLIYVEISRGDVSLLGGRSPGKPVSQMARQTTVRESYQTLRGSTW